MFTFILGQYWFACYHSYSIVVMLFACCGPFLISPSFVKWLLPGEDFPQEPTSRSRAPAPFCLTTAVWICSSYRPVTTPILIPLLCPPLSWPASPTQQCAFRGSGDLAHLHIPGGNVDLILYSSGICRLHACHEWMSVWVNKWLTDWFSISTLSTKSRRILWFQHKDTLISEASIFLLLFYRRLWFGKLGHISCGWDLWKRKNQNIPKAGRSRTGGQGGHRARDVASPPGTVGPLDPSLSTLAP